MTTRDLSVGDKVRLIGSNDVGDQLGEVVEIVDNGRRPYAWVHFLVSEDFGPFTMDVYLDKLEVVHRVGEGEPR